ncbi:MAG: helix-turn-helix transcriptional regulator [Clostridiales bacterium]|nr:helix-turn-helix transcriptional regulator [Clostridiales bacterium]
MTHAYNKTYLFHAANKFGNMMDYAVNDCNLDGDQYLHMFTVSGMAEQFEHGNPRVVAGMSGIEIAMETIRTVCGKPPAVASAEIDYRTAEYWGGWALAHYQWQTALSFSAILRFLPFADILIMYPTLHEADITKFYETANGIYAHRCPKTNLKRIREAAGLSQAKLAAEAEVSLRCVQMYEQRNKDINKAQAITLVKIAKVLGCSVEALVELV